MAIKRRRADAGRRREPTAKDPAVAVAPERRNRYDVLIESIFLKNYRPRDREVAFTLRELKAQADALHIVLVDNPPDIVYSYRSKRFALPQRIAELAGEDEEWIIAGAGKGKYRFRIVPAARIEPRPDLYVTKIPDATPQIVLVHKLSNEQALLARIRYNRLIDTFLGVTAYSLQNHLRTTVKGIGQIEMDELYAAVNTHGAQFIIPVEAKGEKEKIAITQLQQDLAFSLEKFPESIPRAVATQFIAEDTIAMFELTIQDDRVVLLDERHYKLVPADQITSEDLRVMARGDSSSNS